LRFKGIFSEDFRRGAAMDRRQTLAWRHDRRIGIDSSMQSGGRLQGGRRPLIKKATYSSR
jgi:hypothetical protein